jgi:hypothetical protein
VNNGRAMKERSLTAEVVGTLIAISFLLKRVIDDQLEDSPQKTMCEAIIDQHIPPLVQEATIEQWEQGAFDAREMHSDEITAHDPVSYIKLYALLAARELVRVGGTKEGCPANEVYTRLMFLC